jgi:hypothetical protein
MSHDAQIMNKMCLTRRIMLHHNNNMVTLKLTDLTIFVLLPSLILENLMLHACNFFLLQVAGFAQVRDFL